MKNKKSCEKVCVKEVFAITVCEPPDLSFLLENGLLQSDITKITRKLCLLHFVCKNGKLKIFVVKSAHLAVRCSVFTEQAGYILCITTEMPKTGRFAACYSGVFFL